MNTRRFRLNLPYLALGTCLILATVMASVLFARLTHEHLDANDHPVEDLAWPIFQVQAEFLRVRQLVAEAMLSPTAPNQAAALDRYEIFISRLPIVARDSIRQALAERPELQALIDRTVAAVENIDREIEAVAAPEAKVALLHRRLAGEADLIQRLALKAHPGLDEKRHDDDESRHHSHVSLAILFGIVVVVVLAFTIMAWRQFHDLEQSRSDLVAISESLEAEKERAVLASQAKSIFLANMSHELRTPLNAIIGFADVIASQMLGPAQPPRYAEYAGDIHRSGQHLLSLVNDLLDLARIEAGRMTLEPKWLGLRAECLAAIGTCDEEARRSGIALERVEIDPGLRVRADQRALRQILLNLLSNALKFTPVGGEISIKAERDERSLRLCVEDTGAGIAPELLKHLMEPFVRGALQSVNGQQGTGLGLSISRRLMEQHGGSLRIESKVGQGTTAILVFPAASVMLGADNCETPPAVKAEAA